MYIGSDKDYYKKLLTIAIPVVIQNLITIGLNMIDTLMIGLLGERELAAVGIANQVFFIFSVSLFGLYSGMGVYTSQFFGAKNRQGVKEMVGIGAVSGMAIGLMVTAITYFFSAEIIGLFSRDNQVILLGSRYLKTACFSYVFYALSMIISYNSRAIQKLTVVTIINFTALCINAALNYILIFGHLGLPAKGVNGAAIATLIARILEMLVLWGYVNISKNHWLGATIKEYLGFSTRFYKKVMKLALPVLITETAWSGGVALIFAAYGFLGTAALATVQVANVTTELLQSFYFGVGNGNAMIIGEHLGEGRVEEAFACGKRSIKLTWLLNLIIGVSLVIIARPLTYFYDFNPETNELIVTTIIVMAVAMAPKMLAYMYIVGILRAGGDTVFSMHLELICNLGLQVPAAFIAVLWLKATLPVAIGLVSAVELVRIVVVVRRFNSRKWINCLVENE